MSAQEDVSEMLPFDFVFAGRRALKGGKAGVTIFRIVDGALSGRYSFDSSNLKKAVIGGVYRGAKFNDDSVWGLSTAQFVDRWRNEEDCIDWRAQDDAFAAHQRTQKLTADAKKVNELETLLLPLRKRYAAYHRNYDNAGKEALEQALMRALRSPPRKTEL